MTLRTDDECWKAIDAETGRQERQLELIASENHASREVMAAMGSPLTNKYAEGYPGRRYYYGGCEHVDTVENLARDRAKELFGSPAANVQPHSGTQANMGAYMGIVQPGAKFLAMSLDHGGHLSHGHPKNFSGAFYEFHEYGVDRDSSLLDMDAVMARAKEVRPDVLVAGASAYPRVIDFPAFRKIADEVGARFVVDMAHIAGLVAAGVHPSPVGIADVVTMTTHKTLRGPRGGMVLSDRETMKKINSAIFPGGQGGPLMHVIAAKAIAFKEAMAPEFKTYQEAVVANARKLGEGLAARGLRIVSGGTDNHLLLVDVGSKGLSGREAEDVLHEVELTCNKNLIPFDERPPMEASGVRIGTAAITTRGLGLPEMERLANWIADVIEAPQDAGVKARVAKEVQELSAAFPIYPAAPATA
ncbi:MAG: serine hydroxymethyltransferase [Planctomycetota bacterium]